MKNLIKAVDWKPVKHGNKIGIQLYTENGNLVEGKDAYWEGNFYCSHNKLTTLEGAPGTVGGDFNCSESNLTTLEGAPSTVGGGFYCSNNKLTTLEGAPGTVGVDFYCSSNNLTTLEGAPSTVGGSFYCSNNKLTTLEGAPSTVGGSFYCYINKLTTLEGAPGKVGGSFYCSDNNLATLEGAPKKASKEQLFQVFLDKGYIFADGILDRLISSKQLDDKTIYKVRKIGNSDTRFVVKRGNATSHGNTIKEAIEDLKYKISDRDTTEYEAWTLSTEASLEEMIRAYRKITGACVAGVRGFVRSTEIPTTIKVRDVIKLTKGEYGNEEFEKFFVGGR